MRDRGKMKKGCEEQKRGKSSRGKKERIIQREGESHARVKQDDSFLSSMLCFCRLKFVRNHHRDQEKGEG